MSRLIFRLFIVTSVLFCVLLLTASLVGTTIQAHVVTYITTQEQPALNTSLAFNLLDLERDLKVRLRSPVQHIRAVALNGAQDALILTKQSFPEQNMSQVGLFRYNLADGEIRAIYDVERSGSSRYQINDIRQDLDPRYSPDSSHIAFYDAAARQLILHDLQQGREAARVDIHMNVQNGIIAIYTWSPDSQQIAIGIDSNRLLIMNRDGSNPREFDLGNRLGFQVSWANNSRELLISQFIIGNVPLRMLDVETMTLSPLVGKVKGTAAYWICEGRYIAYRRTLPDNRSQIRLLEPATGQIIKLNRTEHLNNSNITLLGASPGCNWMLALEQDFTTIVPSGVTYTNFVQLNTLTASLINLTTGASRLLTREMISYEFDPFDENSLIYTRVFEDGAYGIFRVNLEENTAGTRIHHYRPFLNGFGRLNWITEDSALQLLTPDSIGRLYLYQGGTLILLSAMTDNVREYAYWTMGTQ